MYGFLCSKDCYVMKPSAAACLGRADTLCPLISAPSSKGQRPAVCPAGAQLLKYLFPGTGTKAVVATLGSFLLCHVVSLCPFIHCCALFKDRRNPCGAPWLIVRVWCFVSFFHLKMGERAKPDRHCRRRVIVGRWLLDSNAAKIGRIWR